MAAACARRHSSTAAAWRDQRDRDRRGEKRRIDRTGTADREGGDRHAGRHLNDRQQAVEPAQRLALDRYAQHRQRRQRRGDARQMGGAARAGDDRLEAGALAHRGHIVEPLGGAWADMMRVS